MSVQEIHVMQMQSVPILKDHTRVNVRRDSLGMENHAKVSNLLNITTMNGYEARESYARVSFFLECSSGAGEQISTY